MEKDILVKQQRIAALLLAWRIPGTVTSFISAVASRSMVLWLEFIEQVSILLPGFILAFLSYKLGRSLKFRFNYGTGKVEAIGALSCEMFDIAGLSCIVFFSIRNLIHDHHEEGSLKFALVMSVLGLIIDLFILTRQRKLTQKEHSKMLHTAYVSAQKEFWFDIISIITLRISIAFKESSWIRYFPNVVCLIMVVPFAYMVLKAMKGSVAELLDRTLDEEIQLQIVKVLTEHYGDYEGFSEVRSRVSGRSKLIDIGLRFSPDMPYGRVREIAQEISAEIAEKIGDCTVNIIIE